MICHESNIKIDRKHRSSISIERDLEHDSKLQILFSDLLLSADLTPINLTVTVQDATTVLLDWDDLAAEYDSLDTSFRVYVRNTVSGEIEQQIDSIQLSEAEVMGLTELEQYEFWVFTMVGDYESAESNHVFATPEQQQPDAPQNFSVEVVKAGSIFYIYDYEIYRKDVGGGTTQLTNDGHIKGSIDVDLDEGLILCTGHGSSGEVATYNLDGSNRQMLVSYGYHHGGCFDKVEKKIYFTYGSANAVYRMNYDGSNIESSIINSHGTNQQTVLIDHANSYFFHNANSMARFSYPDGAYINEVRPSTRNCAINPDMQMMALLVLSDPDHHIVRINYDGSNEQRIVDGFSRIGINYVNNGDGFVGTDPSDASILNLYDWETGDIKKEIAQLDHAVDGLWKPIVYITL